MKRLALLSILALSGFLISSCVSYTRGLPNDPEYATVYVKPIINDSSFPLLESSLTSKTRKTINETGFLRTDDKENADTTLQVEIFNFSRDIEAIQKSDLGREKKLSLQMVVSISLYEGIDTSAPIFENRTFTVRQDIFSDSDITTAEVTNQVDAEHQATPELSRKIATRIAEILTESW
ncbi:LPS assembly lipoprotein LptE [Puniceicoccaceae bacterium K14]|nr:LPS assembly lipoprotein LptE [Puniceicoccaceae bacterium K14]